MVGPGVTRGRLAVLRVVGQRHLVLIDVVVAILLTVGGVIEVANLTYSAPTALGVVSCIACTAPVALRRRVPFITAFVVTSALVVYQIATKDPDGSFVAPAYLLVYYYAGRTTAERSAWKRLGALLSYALAADIAIEVGTGPFSLLGALTSWPLALAPGAAGIIVARHGSLLRRLTDATASLRDEQRVRAERLVGEERNRVARELHDVVAHHVSVMVIQAGGARLVAASDSAAADEALQVVERSGRQALTDLRRIMGVMRRGDAPDADTCIGLAHLDQLVERTRDSGVPVDVEVSGRLDLVPSAVDLVAYRVLQEALTNVVKHGRPATARVTIQVGQQTLEMSVTDDGSHTVTPPLPGSGHGLIGMRERVALYGGQLTSGSRAGGGFEVRAVIPLRTEPLSHQTVGDEVRVSPPAHPRRGVTARRWLAELRPWSDRILAGCWLIALEVDALTDQYRRGPLALNMIVVAGMAVAFAWRRRVPLVFLFVVGLAAVPLSSGLTSDHSTLVGFYCATIPTFTVAAWLTRSRAIAGLAFWIAGTIGFGVAGHEGIAGLVGGLILSCLLWTAGRLRRNQRVLAERLADTHVLLAAEREDRERLAIASERARIARQLHTEVAQGLVTMIVQATAARFAIRDNPDTATVAISAIEQTGREALARMRDILGVLRAQRDLLQVRPQPGVEQLHAMIHHLREAGRSVELRVEGDPAPLPAGIDLTIYRIVEAALAEADPRPSRGVTVVLRFREDRIEVEATGSGLQLPDRLRLTVRERTALCNGTVLPPAAELTPRLLVHLPIITIAEAVPV